MIVRKTYDRNEIKEILCHPEIYELISDDDSPPRELFTPPIEGVDYLGCYVNNEIIGLSVYNYVNDNLYMHFQVLPVYRKKYARKFARMALDIGKAKNASIYAEIPVCFPNVISFAEGFGFEIIGKKNEGRKKSGIVHEVKILRLSDGIRK